MPPRIQKPHIYPIPSNYELIKKVRASKTATLNESKYIKPTTKLRYYQVVGTLNLLLLKYFILGDEPGLGKTVQCLVAYAILKTFQPDLQLIVFTTKSAKDQWGDEVDKFLQGLSYHVMKGSYKPKGGTRKITGKDCRDAQYLDQKDTDIFISGYYPLTIEPNHIRSSRGGNLMVVFDEVHLLKNNKSKTYVGAEEFLNDVSMVYGLTATPIKNRLLEFYYVYKLIMPQLFPKVTWFKKEFCNEVLKNITPYSPTPKFISEIISYKNLPRFREIIDPYFFRRSADDVGSELPGIVSRRIMIAMSPSQERLYSEAKKGIIQERKVRQRYLELLDKAGGNESLVPDKIKEMYQDSLTGDFLKKHKTSSLVFCQLASNGPQWLDPEETGNSTKEDALEDLLEGELLDQKVVIYSRYNSGIPRLEKIADKLGIKHVKVTGSESDSNRTKAKNIFQDPDSDVKIIFITDAGSASINLQVSGYLVLFDSPWTWGDLVQLVGRVRRLNSEHQFVLVYHLVEEGTIDERVLFVLKGKKELVEKAVGPQPKGLLCFDGIELESIGNNDGRSEVDILFDDIFG